MIRRAKVFLVALVLVLPLSGGAKPLVYCSEANPETLNTAQSLSATVIDIGRIVYSNLVKIERGSTRIVADAAQRWTVSKDGKTYTFFLRPGIQFHTSKKFQPTRALNAHDVVFSFGRMLNKDNPYHKVGRGAYPRAAAMGFDRSIVSYRALDDLTFEIRLRQPMSSFLSELAHPAFGLILSKEYADQLMAQKTPGDIDHEPIGSGPFRVAKFKRDALIRFKAHQKYFGERAKVKDLIFVIAKEPSVRKFKLLKGECDIAFQPAPADIPELEKNPNVVVRRAVGLNIGYLGFNFKKPPLDNLLVRQAIYHALNRQSYIKSIYLGNAVLASSPLAPAVWSHRKTAPVQYAYDPERAKELLKMAGYSKGLTLELWTLPVARLYNPNGKKMGELMQEDLSRVGIKVKLVTFEWATFLAKGDRGEHQMYQLGWSQASGDPDETLYPNLSCDSAKSGNNWSRWCHKDFDRYLKEARRVSSKKQRIEFYHKAQDVFLRDVPWVPLVHGYVYHGVSKAVKNFIVNPSGSINFEQLSL